MKLFMQNTKKNDLQFLLALAIFGLIAYIRFFSNEAGVHIAPLPIMTDYRVSVCAIALYFIALFTFFYHSIVSCDISQKKIIYYLISFCAIFAFPMYLYSDYFGCMDVYALILTLILGICLVKGKVEWLAFVLSPIMSFISPMSLFGCVCMISVLYVYKFFAGNGTKYFVYGIMNIFGGLLGFLLNRKWIGFYSDAQENITFYQFIAIILFMIPYFLLAISFFVRLVKRSTIKKIIGCVFLVCGVLPSVMVYAYIKDYSRLLFYGFFYFSFAFITLYAGKDKDFLVELDVTKRQIVEWVPIPSLLIAYPLLFMTLWVSGPLVLFVETFVGS